jgi:hypothetical protein
MNHSGIGTWEGRSDSKKGLTMYTTKWYILDYPHFKEIHIGRSTLDYDLKLLDDVYKRREHEAI